MSTKEDTFWKVQDDSINFWNAYVSTRPVYSDSFYNEIFDYHGKHSSDWNTAHDIACGAGQDIIKLASRFQHVVASDCHDTHLDVAKENAAGLDAAKVSFIVAKGEDIYQHYPHASADLIICSESMPALDEATAMHSFGKLLRPGGTLALSFYGRPIFTEPAYLKCQSILDQIMECYFLKMFRPTGEPIPEIQMGVLRQVTSGMASWLDYIDFDPTQWTDVRRIKWNPDAVMEFFGEGVIGEPVGKVSKVRPTESILEKSDPDWWCREFNITDLRLYFRVLFPGFEKITDAGDEQLERLFLTMEQEIGGKEARRKFTWATVLVLATKS